MKLRTFFQMVGKRIGAGADRSGCRVIACVV